MTDGEKNAVMNLVSSLSRQLGQAESDIWMMTYFLEKGVGYITDEHGGEELKEEIVAYLDRRNSRAALKENSDE